LFAHYSSIQMEGYKTLRAGQDVEFDVLQGPKGLHAVNIRSLDELVMDAGAANGSTANGESRAPAYAGAAAYHGGPQSTS
jgi:cold shock protein